MKRQIYSSNERGFALLMTLLIIVLLGVVVIEFSYSARVYLLQEKNRVARLKAFYLARSGINWGRHILLKDKKKSKHDGLNEDWAKEIINLPLGEGTLSVKVVDEEGKFNINTLVRNNGNIDAKALERFKRLLGEIGFRTELADEIVEFLSGKEETQYNINELTDLLKIGILSLREFNQLKRFVTVITSGPVNINTSLKEVLASLSNKLTPFLVDEIIKYREEKPFESKNDVDNVPGIDSQILTSFFDAIDIKSNFFTVIAYAEVNGIVNGIEALLKRKEGTIDTVIWKEK